MARTARGGSQVGGTGTRIFMDDLPDDLYTQPRRLVSWPAALLPTLLLAGLIYSAGMSPEGAAGESVQLHPSQTASR